MSTLKDFDFEYENKRLNEEILDLKSKILQAEQTAQKAIIESELRTAALAAGMRPDAVRGAVSTVMGQEDFRITSQGAVARYVDGEPIVDTHRQYVPAEEYFKQVHKAKLPSFYTDAQAQASKAEVDPDNPWTREHWNITRQWRVAKFSLDEARKLAKAAGSSLDATQPPPARS